MINEPDKIKNDIVVVDYTERAIAVFGQTYGIKDKLIDLGGKFNKFLTNPKTGVVKRIDKYVK